MKALTLGVLAALFACGRDPGATPSEAAAPAAPRTDDAAEPTLPTFVPAAEPNPARRREPFTGCERNGDLPAPTPASGRCEGLLRDVTEPRFTEFRVCGTWSCGEPLGLASGTLAARLSPWSHTGIQSPSELFTWRGNGEARLTVAANNVAFYALPSVFAFVEGGPRGYWPGDVRLAADDVGPIRSFTLPWGQSAAGPWHAAADGEGRIVMAAVVSASSAGPFDLQVSRVDPVSGDVDEPVSVLYMNEGQPLLGLGPLSPTSEVKVGVDLAGRVLVLWNGEWSCGFGTLGGRWLGPDLVPLGPPFVAGEARDGSPLGDLEALLDGTLVLRSATWGTYTRRFEYGLPAGGAVPSWLSEPEFGDVVRLPGDRGYARLPFSKLEVSPGTCVAGLEILARDGHRCGTLRLEPAEPCSEWSPMMLGAVAGDGTVVRRLEECPKPDASWTCCRYAWWPKLLAP